MKRIILYILFGVTLILALGQPIVLDFLVAFFFLGIIPGTEYVIPFWLSFIGLIVGSTLLILWLLSQPLYIGSIAAQDQTARDIARKKVVAQAYSTKAAKPVKRRLLSAKPVL